MADWRDIGKDNFNAARYLFHAGNSHYRSAVSRFYYAAFCIVTYELSRAGVNFGEGQETPSHKGLPKLMKVHLTLASKQKQEAISSLRRLYSARISADYQLRSTDKAVAREAMRDAAALFRYLGVNYND